MEPSKYLGRARNLLAATLVEEFAAWLMARGWSRIAAPHGRDEVLRMRHEASGELLLVTRRADSTRHVTVSGVALQQALLFIDQRRANGGKE